MLCGEALGPQGGGEARPETPYTLFEHPMAVVTNYHNIGHLKHKRIYEALTLLRLDIQNQVVYRTDSF